MMRYVRVIPVCRVKNDKSFKSSAIDDNLRDACVRVGHVVCVPHRTDIKLESTYC